MADEATAVNDAPITEATDSAPVETGSEDNFDSFDLDESDFTSDDSKEEGKVETDDAEADDTASDTQDETDTEDTPDDDTQTEDVKPTKDEKRQELIRNLVNERNQLRKQNADLLNKVYEARTPEQLQEEVNPDTGENYTALEARVIAAEEKQALRDYADQVSEAQLAIQVDAQNVVRDFPMFDEKSPEFNKELAAAADELLNNNFIRDPNTEQVDDKGNRIPGSGQITGQHLPTYNIYKLINDAVTLGKNNGVLEGQKNARKMFVNADTPSSGSPKNSKKDAGIDAFDKELDRF